MTFKYKLICLDLDGTLLTSDRRIDDETLRYLRRLVDSGVKVAIATGRAVGDAIHHAEQISSNTYYICSNGAAAGITAEEGYLYEDTLNSNEVSILMEASKKLKVSPVLYTSQKILVPGIRDYLMHRFLMAKDNPALKRRLRFLPGRKKLMAYIESQPEELVQKAVFFIAKDKKQRQADRLLSDELFEKALTFNICFEISAKGINKSHGIMRMAQHLGIDADEIIAFGDSENDREMLKYVGMGVAMGNADSKIKEIADAVTMNNDDKGVLVKLQEVFAID